MKLRHPLQMNIQVRKLHLMIQHFMILQLQHTSLITQSLKEIRSGLETGLKDTGLLHNNCSHIEDVHLLFCAHFPTFFSFWTVVELRHFTIQNAQRVPGLCIL